MSELVAEAEIIKLPSAQYAWSQLSVSNAPLPRSSHCVSVIGSKVYVIGGENTARVPINSDVHVLDFDLKDQEELSWRCVTTEGTPMSHRIAHAQAVIGTCIWLYGGREGITMGEGPLSDVHCFDTVANTWSTPNAAATSQPPPPPRSFHKMVAVGSVLYVFGGCGESGRMNDLYSYDTTTHSWTALLSSDNIAGRGGPSVAAVSGPGVLVTAGFSGQENNDIHFYDLDNNSWRTGTPREPYRPRSVCPTASLQGGRYVVLFGGEVSTSDRGHEGAGAFEQDVVCIEVASGEVCRLEAAPNCGELPSARGWTEMCLLREDENTSTVVMFGGLSGKDEDPIRLNDTWKLSVTIL